MTSFIIMLHFAINSNHGFMVVIVLIMFICHSGTTRVLATSPHMPWVASANVNGVLRQVNMMSFLHHNAAFCKSQ